ncbi:hypothetical protein DOY81_008060 [Sarcophaga bullata]|nr:hypothetical protein DOY81_008060 [Sarcophaga bullata]
MLKTHLSGIKKICKNSVWHHHLHYHYHQQQQRYQQQRAYGHQNTTTRQRATLTIWKICCRSCLRKRRKFHDLTKIQNLWFGSNQNIIPNCNNNNNNNNNN